MTVERDTAYDDNVKLKTTRTNRIIFSEEGREMRAMHPCNRTATKRFNHFYYLSISKVSHIGNSVLLLFQRVI